MMPRHRIQYTQLHTKHHQIIYLESELREHLTVEKCMFILTSCTTNLGTNYQINFTLFLQDWGFSMTSNLGSKKRKKKGSSLAILQ